MFDVFRKHTKTMMWVLFLLIIPSFVLFGIDGYNQMDKSDEAVARVNGQEITKNQWESAHRAEIERLTSSMPNIDVKLLDTPQAKFATLERLVRDRVLFAAAEKYKVSTTDAKLAKYLQEDPTIASLKRPDGSIDMDKYRQLAAMQGLTTEGLENGIRSDLSKDQIDAGLRTSGLVSTAMADVALSAYFEKREVQVLQFKPSNFLDKVSVSDEESTTFYQANQQLFKAPEQADIEYVVLDLEAVKSGIQIPEADLKAYYDQNALKLSGTEERRARHILINASKTSAQDELAKARVKAEEVLAMVKAKPGDFPALAAKFSQDPGSASKGGDLDFFARGAMVKPFEDAVFAMKKGDVSELVQSDFGFHIIQLTDVKLPKQREFNDLKASIEADLKAQQAQRKYAESAEIFTNMVYEQSDSLKPVAEKLKLSIKTAGNVNRSQASTSGVFASEKFMSALFATDSVEKKRNTEAVEISVNQLVAGRVVKYQPAKTMALADVKPMVLEKVSLEKAQVLAKNEAQNKLTQFKSDSAQPLPTALIVSRDQTNGLATPIVVAALRADTVKLPSWVDVDLGTDGVALVRVNKVLKFDPKQKPSIQNDRTQHAAWWNSAENAAYLEFLKKATKVEMLVAKPAL